MIEYSVWVNGEKVATFQALQYAQCTAKRLGGTVSLDHKRFFWDDPSWK